MIDVYNEDNLPATQLPSTCTIEGYLVGGMVPEPRRVVELAMVSRRSINKCEALRYAMTKLGEFGTLPHTDAYWRDKCTYVQLGRATEFSVVYMCVGVVEYFFPVMPHVDEVSALWFGLWLKVTVNF